MKVMDTLRSLDAFPKHGEEFRVRTTHGAMASVVAIVAMLYLFVSEFYYYSRVEVVDRLVVNSSHADTLKVRFDIKFHHIPCDLLSLDAMDTSGQRQEELVHNVFKRKLDAEGNKADRPERHRELGTLQHEHQLSDPGEKPACGNCYGARDDPDACCNTCEEVRIAYEDKGWAFHPDEIEQCQPAKVLSSIDPETEEGCNIFGNVELTKLSGNFHFAPGEHLQAAARSGQMSFSDLMSLTYKSFNISHDIRTLAFGNHFPGIQNPLDRQSRSVSDGSGMYQYYVKVVPTTYKFLNRRRKDLVSNQYSVTEHLRHVTPGSGRGLPGVWFFYEVSPVQATFEETRQGTLEFIASVCAILGGVFTIIGLA
eukprot:CAMPEP_0118964408 /NCGR_PEP_ID=MMETSP1173-20130426/2111_1 /TAXON_ID=1034831 /ORGANISM="Rhizochromulina marina cf, Strain CCMP1243" /LENGTH=366 /DNA_ID=CAMNT_0006912863 /DNA_START=8 /DNA_END=1105 /DNA_ORIENTATION=-